MIQPARSAGVRVADDLDVFEARWSVRKAALAIGFAARDAEELVLAASELATNILKFGSPGRLTVEPLSDPERGAGIRIVAHDSGPPIPDFERVLARSAVVGAAMEWTGRGLGGGLGAVLRFSDRVECVADPGGHGKHIVVERYLRRPRR
jgi:serine/threonine-protein kinase RsbT